ncbi:MAG: hypothetical protein AAGD01_18360 [Acidobacteriota bacterium]
MKATSKSIDPELALVRHTIARLRARIVAMVTAMVAGSGLFLATVWLIIKGGPHVGQNLSLLSAYYPGYSVTWGGSFLGFFYGALTGALIGWSIAWLYNLLVSRRSGE